MQSFIYNNMCAHKLCTVSDFPYTWTHFHVSAISRHPHSARRQYNGTFTIKMKVKQSLNWSGQALRVPGVWDSLISIQSTHNSGKVSRTHRPPLPGRSYSWCSFLLVRPEGLCQWKIHLTPSGIEPATFQRSASANCSTILLHHIYTCNSKILLTTYNPNTLARRKYKSVTSSAPWL